MVYTKEYPHFAACWRLAHLNREPPHDDDDRTVMGLRVPGQRNPVWSDIDTQSDHHACSTHQKGAIMAQPPAFTADEQKINDAWNEHLRTEFSAHSADEAIATMVAHPRVNQVPVMIGGDGKDELYEFYAHYFLPQIPPDMEMVPVSRTIGQGRLVEEMVVRFTHTIPMAGML